MTNTNKQLDTIVDAYRSYYKEEGFIPLHEPCFSDAEVKAVSDCVASGWVSTAGEYIGQFSERLRDFTAIPYVVPVVNGTSALHLGLRCLGLSDADEVLCPDLSFVATAAAIHYTGAGIVFLDVDADTMSLSPDALRHFIEHNTEQQGEYRVNRKTGRRIAACIMMHNIGFVGRIQDVVELCRRYNIVVIEDAAEALGSTLNNRHCGSFGFFGIYSFNGNKIITTGGGGALVTHNEALYKQALHLSTTAKTPHAYRYVHDEVGYNYRMPNLNAALGVAQLDKLPSFITTKRQQFKALKEMLDGVIHIQDPPFGEANHWFLTARVEASQQDALLEQLNQRGIMSRPVWSRISQLPPYQGYQTDALEQAKHVESSVICLPNPIRKERL